ncbi:MAG: class I SAM-dependent methyltransferase [Acidobacteriota bacterium]
MKGYYTAQAREFGRAVVTERHRRQAATIVELTGIEKGRVLELGAGSGGLAMALAELGHETWAIDFNPTDAALARELAASRPDLPVTMVEADFCEVELEGRFDLVFYWDGFGVGCDEDQRRLLRRCASDWLEPNGRVLLDVFSPWNWQRREGEVTDITGVDGTTWQRRLEYSVLRGRFTDHWTSSQRPGVERSQTIRCYTLQELELLCVETGLSVERFFTMSARPFLVSEVGDGEDGAALETELRKSNGYWALLQRSGMMASR